MKSMTGFGRGECIGAGTRYTVEISAVNRRNAELIFNLPRELVSLEGALRAVIAPEIVRGRATVTVSISAVGKSKPLLDPGVFRRLHGELSELRAVLKISDAPSLSDLVRLYAVTVRETSTAPPPDVAALISATHAALRSLVVMKKREGAHLAKELRRLLAGFCREVAIVEKLAPSVVAGHRDAMRARLAALSPDFAAGDERLVRELALFADRSDITEELSRLQSHIRQFRTGLASDGAGGRQLDFLAQEMFRECNTIGSKANLAAITHGIVAAKTELERIREQVQNVE